MNTLEWIEAKTSLIEIQLEDFFKINQLKLHMINTYPIICNYLSVNNDIEGLEQRSFEDYNVLYQAFMKYQNIISKINLEVVFVASKENFCFFMGWTAKFYDDMLNSTNDDIRAMMEMINDYIIDSQLSAGQRGFIKANLTKFRAQTAGEHGHSLITQKEQLSSGGKSTELKSKEQLIAELEGMGLNKQLVGGTYSHGKKSK